MNRIDAHCHFWDPARGDYGWLDAAPPALDPLRRAFLPDELAGQNGGRQVIAVQAADTLAETRYLLSLARENRQIVGVVGWVDLSRAEAAEDMASLARDPAFKGVRPMLQDLPEDDWIATRPHPAAMQTLLELGLSFDALVHTRHLPALARFVAAWPGLPVMVDHCAKPDLSRALDPAWLSGMRDLARHRQVWCKLSGLLTELPADQRSPERAFPILQRVVSQIIALFGPERVVWGSDWPVLTLAADYQAWNDLTLRLLGDLSAKDRDAILGRNACDFYWIGGGT